MGTILSRDTVIGIGAGNKASLLLDQAGYTLDQARRDGEALTRLLPDGYLDHLVAVIALVRDALQNPAFASVESDGPAPATEYLRDFPEEVRDYFFRKGSLFIAVKLINSAGRVLHLCDPAAAARYNLSVLNRAPAAAVTRPRIILP